jgi:hypothetical protein
MRSTFNNCFKLMSPLIKMLCIGSPLCLTRKQENQVTKHY